MNRDLSSTIASVEMDGVKVGKDFIQTYSEYLEGEITWEAFKILYPYIGNEPSPTLSQGERKKRVKGYREALAINSLGNDTPPSDFANSLYQKHIEGEMTSDEVVEELVRHYKVPHDGQELFEQVEKRLKEVDMAQDYRITEKGLMDRTLRTLKAIEE